MLLALAALAWLAPVDTVQAQGLAAAGCEGANGSRPFARIELFFGLSRPGGVISDAEFRRFIDTQVTPLFPAGLTVLAGAGQFRADGGEIVAEGSRLLILLVPRSDRHAGARAEQVRAACERQFAQQSVWRSDDVSCVSFGPADKPVSSSSHRPSMQNPTPDASVADTDPVVATLAERAAQAHVALMEGDLERYRGLIETSDDFVLMSPFGGKPSRAADFSDESWAAIGRFFSGGRESTLELVQSWRSDDLVVLAAIERTRAEVGGLPSQRWALRVTLVFKRQGDAWQLAHRHADPLVGGIPLQQAATLASGQAP